VVETGFNDLLAIGPERYPIHSPASCKVGCH
jgi:hypothetical protein